MNLNEKTLSSKSVFDGKILHITLDEIELPDGKTSKREVVNHPGGVAVAALDCDNNLFFVKQFRYPYKEVVLELPAGKLEKVRLRLKTESVNCLKKQAQSDIHIFPSVRFIRLRVIPQR